MATALQKQLAAIAASSTQQLDLKAQKTAHGKSLLFDPKVAVTQDFDTIYQICLEGFHDLCNLDRRYSTFATTLFNAQSKSAERTEMTEKENEDLNQVLESFLGLASSRILLKPAVKAIEWLVRRFRVHEYNTEFMILTFLPYHETPIFATLLSILPPRLPQTFRFLHPYMTSVKTPTRPTITYAALNSTALLTAVNNYVLKLARTQQQYPSLLSFWASLITQTIDGMMNASRSGRVNVQQKRQEDLLLLVLPVLNEGLTFRHAPDMVIACYTVITVLVAKGNFEDQVLDTLMEAVIKSRRSADVMATCLVCLAVITQDRSHARFPKGVEKRVLKLEDLMQQLPLLAEQCRVDRFVLGYVLALMHHAEPNDLKVLDDIEHIIDMNLLEDAQILYIFKSLFDFDASEADPATRTQFGSMISHFNRSASLGPLLRQTFSEKGKGMETLELELGTVLHDEDDQAQTGAADKMETDNEPNGHESRFEEHLNAVRAQTQDEQEMSFLKPESTPLYDRIANLIVLAASSSPEQRTQAVLNLPVLQRSGKAGHLPFFSFLLRLGSTSPSSIARATAYREVTKALDELVKSGHNQDYQVLIPFLVGALGDASMTVRRAAAEATVSVHRMNKATKKSQQQKTGGIIWGKDSLYETPSDMEWLSVEDSSKAIAALLVPSLEECVLDAQHAEQAVSSALGGHAKERSKGGNGGEGHAELKSSLRAPLASFLASHAIRLPSLKVKLAIYSILGKSGKYGSHARTHHLLPLCRAWFELDGTEASRQCRSKDVEYNDAENVYMGVIHPRDRQGIQLLQDIFAGKVVASGRDIESDASARLRAMWPELKPDMQSELASFLLELSLVDSSEPVLRKRSATALETLRTVSLPTAALVSFLEESHMPEAEPPAKKRRTSGSTKTPVGMDGSSEMRKMTLVLELIESSSPEQRPELLRGLFQVMGELQRYRATSASGVVYLQQLAISSLLSIVKVAKNDKSSKVDPSSIRTDLLVDCVRNTSNPQVQNSALLLISNLASWMPEIVLHSVMPIFTFMSSTLLRQSDDYSVHVIDQTVSRVVPPLADSLRRRNRNFILGVSELLLSFTAAYEHIPLHRRLELFTQLVHTLGPQDSFAAAVALLLERYPTDSSLPHFVSDMMKTIDIATILKAYKQYIDLIEDALSTRRQLADTLFAFKEKKAPQVEQSLINLINGLVMLLRDQQLATKLKRGFASSEGEVTELRQQYTQLLEKVILLSAHVKNRDTLSGPSREAILSSLSVLPTIELVQTIETLLEKPDFEIRRTSMRAILLRLKDVKQTGEVAVTAVLSLLPRISSLVQQQKDSSLQYLAVSCINRISETFGKKDTSIISDAAAVITGDYALGSKDERLQVMSLHCLASMVDILRNEFIAMLPVSLPKTFHLLEQDVGRAAEDDTLHAAIYHFLSAIVEHVPFLFSENYLRSALDLSLQSAEKKDSEEAQDNRRQLYGLVARDVDPEQRFAAIQRTWSTALNLGPKAMGEQIELLNMAISNCQKSTVSKNTTILFDIFLQAFDLRRQQAVSQDKKNSYSESDVKTLEESVTSATITLIMKLNDATFRPFFVKLVDWCSKKLPKSDAQGRTLRSITFYRFLIQFFWRLKSLVTSYASYILEYACKILWNSDSKDSNNVMLIDLALQALRGSFANDDSDFWQSPEHFTPLVSPLTSLLTLPSSQRTLIKDRVVPTITSIAQATSSPDHHKALNTAILQHFRSTNAHTRLAAVLAEQSLTARLGEEWLALLPEMLPAIAEAQEDEDEEVEIETHRWIKDMEEVLGESLEGMLQ